MQVTPMPNPRAHIQEPISSGVAWRACAAWNTITAELVKPTSTVTKPATTADADKSLNGFILILTCVHGWFCHHSSSVAEYLCGADHRTGIVANAYHCICTKGRGVGETVGADVSARANDRVREPSGVAKTGAAAKECVASSG